MDKKFDIYQIWFNNPFKPDHNLLKWMDTVITKRPEGSSYTLISPENYFESNKDIIHIQIDIVVKELLKSSKTIKGIWELLTAHQKSELMRTYLASKNENSVYFDCDVELTGWPTKLEDNGKPCISKRYGKTVDNHVFFANGNNEWFKTFLNDDAESMKKLLDAKQRVKYSHTFGLINRRRLEVNQLDNNFFIHHN